MSLRGQRRQDNNSCSPQGTQRHCRQHRTRQGGGDRRWRQEDCWGFTDQLETVLLGKFQTRIEIPSTEKKMRLLPGQQQPRLCFACAYMRMCAHICHTHVHTLKHRESNNDQITGERNHSLESAWASLPLPFCPSQAHSRKH